MLRQSAKLFGAARCARDIRLRPAGSTGLLGEFVPRAHVSDAIVVTLDDHFRALVDRCAVVASRTDAAPRAVLFEDHFTGSLCANRHADGSDYAFEAIVPVIHLAFAVTHEPDHEAKDHEPREKAG